MCVEYGKMKYNLFMKQIKMMTKMKEKFNTSLMDDEYIKKIQDGIDELEPYSKAKHAL